MISATKPKNDPPIANRADIVHEWGEGSFPASDPPSSPMTRIGSPHEFASPPPKPPHRSRKKQSRPRPPRSKSGPRGV